MNRCMRCQRPLTTSTTLCSGCQDLLDQQVEKGKGEQIERGEARTVECNNIHSSSVVLHNSSGSTNSMNETEIHLPFEDGQRSFDENDEEPFHVQPNDQPLLVSHSIEDEQIFYKLHEAARRIAEEEPTKPIGGIRRGSPRLTPFYDISNDIRRDSTPLPTNAYSTQPMERISDEKIAAIWPEVEDESTKDIWANQTDPLLTRSVPSRSNSTIEEYDDEDDEDFEQNRYQTVEQKAAIASKDTLSLKESMTERLWYIPPAWRPLFIGVTILAITVIILDVLLLFGTLMKPSSSHLGESDVQPMLTLSENVVRQGQNITIFIRHFTPNSRVVLTRDIAEPLIRQAQDQSIVQVNDQGAADLTITLDQQWKTGQHTIQAEDTRLRYVANATLQVDAGPAQPPRLIVDQRTIDFGSAPQGATSLTSLPLRNGGSGTITWSATSNQSWLSITPSRGLFSSETKVAIGVARADLMPASYTGQISFTVNGEEALSVNVSMAIQPLASNPGAVFAVTAATFSFHTVDGKGNPEDQYLAVANIGSEPLHWSLGYEETQEEDLPMNKAPLVLNDNWLQVDTSIGVIEPHSLTSIRLRTDTRGLLPGVYNKTILLYTQDGTQAINAPTRLQVSLTVQRRCSVSFNTGNLLFTAVTGHANPSTQAVNMVGTESCQGQIPWRARSSASWLMLNPATGVLNAQTNAAITAGVNVANLSNGEYHATISIIVGAQSTQTIAVKLVVQPSPSPQEPVLGASPLTLNFSTIAGQPDPPAQTVVITNNGGGQLRWQIHIDTISSNWLSIANMNDSIDAGKTGMLNINVKTQQLTAGTYTGQITLYGYNRNIKEASGSPQVIIVNLTVLPPCTLAPPSSTSLAIRSLPGDTIVKKRTITLTATGSCNWPLRWSVVPLDSVSWLSVSPASGSFESSAYSADVTISVSVGTLSMGTYSGRIQIHLVDDAGNIVQGSSQIVNTTLTVLPPCMLQTSTNNLSFTVKQGALSDAQTIKLTTSGTCVFPLSWISTAADNGLNWLQVFNSAGLDDGTGSMISLRAKPGQLAPGTYMGTVLIEANDHTGAPIQGKQFVTVTLTVLPVTVSGQVFACADNMCNASIPLANTTVVLKNSSDIVVGSYFTDATGKFVIPDVPAGTYTLSSTGIGVDGLVYSGSTTVNIQGDQTVNIHTFATSTTTSTTNVEVPPAP